MGREERKDAKHLEHLINPLASHHKFLRDLKKELKRDKKGTSMRRFRKSRKNYKSND
jgi:hypothetical protein|tara:strand:- start:438 stop:608 length:171 start_codon:yes stop_codon:yes gene_type:complete